MKLTNWILCTLLVQTLHLASASTRALPLYRVDSGVPMAESIIVRQLATTTAVKSDAPKQFSVGEAEDFSDESSEEGITEERKLYKIEEAKLRQERRDMFFRNLGSMSMSMSISFEPAGEPEQEIIVISEGESKSDGYVDLRMKLLGLGDDKMFHSEIDHAIRNANKLAHENSPGKIAFSLVDAGEAGRDMPDDSTRDLKDGYGTQLMRLVGLGEDELYPSNIEHKIRKANELAYASTNDIDAAKLDAVLNSGLRRRWLTTLTQ